MTTKTLNKLIKDYQKVFLNLGFKLNQDFKKDFLHIERMKTNSTKISFIKKDKIEGLKENIKGFKIKPNDPEQREKYFTAVKPSKFLNSMILADENKNELFNKISEQFTKDFINNIKSKLVLYSGADISRIYNSASVVGCMSRANQSWFKVYDKTENLQLATLQDAETILMRSLLWYDKDNNNYWLCKSYEQSAINGDNTIRKDYQKKLLCQVIEILILIDEAKNGIRYHGDNRKYDFNLGCNFANSLNSCTIEEIEQQYQIKIFRDVKRKIITETHTDIEGKETERETERSKDRILLQPIIKDFDAEDFESFPYSDTFQSIGRHSGKWFLNCNNGDNDFICCQSTEGEDENNAGQNCECCEERIHEDEIHYSEIEQEYLCEDCATYIEEREDTARTENTTYNNYSGEYLYTPDLSEQ